MRIHERVKQDKKKNFHPHHESKPVPQDKIFLKGDGTNWELFERFFLQHAAKTYGRLGQELTEEEDFGYPIEQPAGNPGEFEYEMGLSRAKRNQIANDQLDSDRPKLFGDIMTHISLTSENKIRAHEDFAVANLEQSPRLLWAIVKATHIGPQHVGRLGTWFLENRLPTCKQGSQRIEHHCANFLRIYDQLVAMGAEVNEASAIHTFLVSLNPVFAQEVTRWVTTDTVEETLDGVMRQATTWYNTTRNAYEAMGGRGQRMEEVSGFFGKDGQKKRGKTRPEKVGICPVCKKRATHPIDKCWELRKMLAERDGKTPAATADAAPEAATASPPPQTAHRNKKGWSAIVHNYHLKPSRSSVLLDTGATNSIWNSKRGLASVHPIPVIKVNGVGGAARVTHAGIHTTFGPVLIMPECPVNLLSFSALRSYGYTIYFSDENCGFKIVRGEDKFYFDQNDDNLYELRDYTTVYGADAEIQDESGQELDDSDESEDHLLTEPVPSMKSPIKPPDLGYTKDEVARARSARDLCRKLGHVGKDALIRALKSGALINSEHTINDVHRAERILGPCTGCKMGKDTSSKRGYERPEIEEPEPTQDTHPAKEILHADILFLPGASGQKNIVLLAVGQRSRFITASRMLDKSKASLETAWLQHVAAYAKNDITVTDVYTDCEANLGATGPVLGCKGVTLHQHAAQSHEPHIERRVRTIKERMRAVVSELRYDLPHRLYWDLLVWCAQGINAIPDTLNTPDDVRSARERVTGRKVDVTRAGRYGFGDCVLYHSDVHANMNLAQRNSVGIVVGRDMDSGNIKVFDPSSASTVTRRTCTPVPLTTVTVNILNNLARQDVPSEALEESLVLKRLEPQDSLQLRYKESYETDEDENDEDFVPEEMDESDGDSDVTYEDEGDLPQPEDEPAPPEADGPKYNLRPNRGLGHANHISIYRLTIEEALSEYGQPARDAMIDELKKLVDLDTFVPIAARGGHVIPGSLFLKPKFDAQGNFTKIKARFVAGGHRQEWSDEDDPSSPTVHWETVLTLCALVARHNLHLECVDVPSAYLHASRDKAESATVVIKMDKNITHLILQLRPEWREFAPDGYLHLEVCKALYGLRESGKLWHDHLTATLTSIEMKRGHADQCVYTLRVQGQLQALVAIYVDDIILIGRHAADVDRIRLHLETSYGELARQTGPDFSFVGATISLTSAGVKVSCTGYIDKICTAFLPASTMPKRTPLPSNFGTPSSPANPTDESEYRSLVMSLMYLAKRCRPDVLFAASYLATRMSTPTKDDYKHAMHVLAYLKGSKTLGPIYRPDAPTNLTCYADAAFALHDDEKSHSGILVYLMGAPVILISTKQKLVTRSSTAAEVVASDLATDAVQWTAALCEDIGFDPGGSPILYQDNTTSILTLCKGAPAKRFRTINIRLEYIKELVKEGRINILYVPTDLMKADGLTKALHGEAFRRFRDWVVS